MERFVGVYRLVSWEVWENGAVTYPLGDAPQGMIMYTAGGHMAVQMMRPDRPLFTSGDRWRSTPEDVQAAYGGYNAYCGRYAVHEAEGYVSHLLEQSLYPNRVGTELQRFFAFTENRLILTTPDSRMTWERVE
ncbi:MAG: lipocalin-like domain-containing protein [Thermomicrobiales bacterium]